MSAPSLLNPQIHGNRAALFVCSLLFLWYAGAEFAKQPPIGVLLYSVPPPDPSPVLSLIDFVISCGGDPPPYSEETLAIIITLGLATGLIAVVCSGIGLIAQTQFAERLRRQTIDLMGVALALLGVTLLLAFDTAVSAALS